MTAQLKIDFVSDVSCPWCAIGFGSLESALDRLKDEVRVDLHFQPFELNPQMPSEGQEIIEHLAEKYGSTPDQIAQTQAAIRARGEGVGFAFGARHRIYNTFDAHRLLYWAELEGCQVALKRALLQAYHGNGEDPSSHEVLVRLAVEAGLDAALAQEILSSGAYATEVREREQYYLNHGINSVPAIIINGKHLIQGGQPPEVFEQALRQIAAQGPEE